ncbi:MAG TPA: cytochrome c biogenesis protein CcsA [Dissulfurispiraceae bacterium]|nr:cytochrome c biogenesis protein CcsA [Dissulfurispiraceae bacterium]
MLWIAFAAFPLYLFGIFRGLFLYGGLCCQVVYLVSRGVSMGRLPLVGPHDTLIITAASVAAFAIPLQGGLRGYPQFTQGSAALAAALTAFALVAGPQSTPLPPVLKVIWFELHVILAFFSYALFGLAAVLGVQYMRNRDSLLEGYQYRAVLLGYCLFSLSMIFGGIWAYLAWGTYWLWTPKELWTSILWLFYSLYLHARLRPSWSGRPAAVLGIAGFGVVMFTYLGVSLLMKSSHTF